MSELLRSVDARTRLAGANKLEILLFTLAGCGDSAGDALFGINVFKVREVMRIPPVTRAPDMAPAIDGMVSLRGTLIPIVDLAQYLDGSQGARDGVMIVTEFNGQTQGFRVAAVRSILRLDWKMMKVPPRMMTSRTAGLVTAVTELGDGRLVMMLDVERILADTIGAPAEIVYRSIRPLGGRGRTVLYADDSALARTQIAATLEAMAVRAIEARNGCEAWRALEHIAAHAATDGKPASEYVDAVLTDVEMPEMDGYMLTRKIKADARLAGIPIIMHSSLSGHSNQQLGTSVGVDDYVSKFEPARLAATLARVLEAWAP